MTVIRLWINSFSSALWGAVPSQRGWWERATTKITLQRICGLLNQSCCTTASIQPQRITAIVTRHDGGSRQGDLLLLCNCCRASQFNVHHTDIINISAAAHNGRSGTSLPSWQPRRRTSLLVAAWCQEAAGHKSRWFFQRVMLRRVVIVAVDSRADGWGVGAT